MGEYSVRVLEAVPENYDLGEITPGKLHITPAPLLIRANDASRLYYSENPEYSYVCQGLLNGDSRNVLEPQPQFTSTATIESSVGEYDIVPSGASARNYTISYINGKLTITPRTLKVSVGDYEREYNQENPDFEVKYDGFAGSDTKAVLQSPAIAKTTASKTSDVGVYAITTEGGEAENYKFTYSSGRLTVNKAEQVIEWIQSLSNLCIGDQVELKATATSRLPVTYSVDNEEMAEIYSTGKKIYLDCKAVGQCYIKVFQEGNKNYYATPRQSKPITIVKSSQQKLTLSITQAQGGAINMPVVQGESYQFSLIAESGWKIHSVMFNRTNITDKLDSENKFFTPTITKNSTLIVVYELDDSAVQPVKTSSLTIEGTSTGARVCGAQTGEQIKIYTSDGMLLKSVTMQDSQTDIPLEKGCIYIIKVSGKTLKLFH